MIPLPHTRRMLATPALALCLAGVVARSPDARAADAPERILRVAKMAAPPAIDGTIHEPEWADACAVTGFRGALFATAYPESLRMVWYLGYDDRNLYLAMDAAFPEFISLKADSKAPDQDNEYMLIQDDHVEIEVTPFGRRRGTQSGYGFYKLMVNPRGVFSDVWYFNGTPGTEGLWSSGARVGCASKPGRWQMEIAWPLESMKIKQADHTELIAQLCRAVSGVGWYFPSWAPGAWTEFGIFYRLILDPDAPAMQFLRHGDIVKRELDALIRLKGKRAGPVQVALSVTDGGGARLFEERKTAEVRPGTAQELSFRASGLKVTDEPANVAPSAETGKNSLDLTVRAGDTLLYTHALAFVRFTPEYEDRYLKPWLGSRPAKGEYKTSTAYYASKGTVRVRVDLDVYGGLPEPLRDAQKVRAVVAAREGGREVARAEFPVENLSATALLTVGDLPDGVYDIRMSLLDGKGKVLDSRSESFTRRRYPWEGNTIGLERVVIPPYRPIEIAGRALKTRGAVYRLGEGGLFDAVDVLGENILRAPMRLEGILGGKAEGWAGGAAALEPGKGRAFPAEFDQYEYRKDCPRVKFEDLPESAGYETLVRAEGRVGALAVRLSGRMEYDGWYQVSLELDPGARPAEVERLDLVIPLWSKADVMLAGRGEEIAQRIPAGEGVVWESRQFGHRPKGFRGTWIPVVYAGNGGRGLWFKGESDEGWVLDDAQSCVFFERDGGAVTLRFRFVNRPVVLRAKRTLTFALQTAPARPLQTLWRRLLWEYPEPSRLWFNTGWCCYGWGGDDFYLPSDDDYRELGRWLLHPESFDTTPPQRHITRMRMDWLKEGRDPAKLPIVLYSSHYVISASHPALETYRGEWAGKNTLAPNRDYFMNQTVLNKGTDFTGRFLWDTPEKCSELAPEWNQRLIECYLWYYRKLAELSGNNGTFWDNAAVFRFTAETPQGVAAQAPEHLFGSVYRGKGKALVWLVNTSEKDQVSDVWLEETALLGKRAARLRDLETGEDMARLPKQAGDARRDATWAHVWVRPHDFRALVLE